MKNYKVDIRFKLLSLRIFWISLRNSFGESFFTRLSLLAASCTSVNKVLMFFSKHLFLVYNILSLKPLLSKMYNLLQFAVFLNWDSFHARLNSHYETWN